MVALDRRVDDSPRKSATAGRDVAVDATGAVAAATGRIAGGSPFADRIPPSPVPAAAPCGDRPDGRRAARRARAARLRGRPGSGPRRIARTHRRPRPRTTPRSPAWPTPPWTRPRPRPTPPRADAADATRARRAGCRRAPALDPVRAGPRPRQRPHRLPAGRPGRRRVHAPSRRPLVRRRRDADRAPRRPPRRPRAPGPRHAGQRRIPPRPPAGRPRAHPSTSRTARPRDRRDRGLGDGARAGAGRSAATAAPSRPRPRSRRTGLRREIFGFLPYWEVNASEPPARLRPDLDDRLLRDRRGRRRATSRSGTPTARPSVGWSGWTSSRLTSIISAAHRNHTRVVLTVQSFGWNTSGLNRQKSLLGSASARAEPRPPDRGRGPRSRRRRRQPGLRAARPRLRERVHGARPGASGPSSTGSTAATR